MTIQKLVLLGVGPAHLHVLSALKAAPRADTDVHVITPTDHLLHCTMLPGLVAGHYSSAACTVQLPALLGTSSIKVSYTSCIGIDTDNRGVQLGNGHTLSYDVLSINARPVVDKGAVDIALPGAKEHAVFTQPAEQFAKLWPQLLTHAANKALRISVVGSDACSVELAMALQHRLAHCRVSLITQAAALVPRYPPSVQQRVLHALKKRNITVLQDTCTAITADHISLRSGATVLCDVPLLTTQAHTPAWLQGPVQAPVFWCNHEAMHSGPALEGQLRAALAGQSLTKPAASSLPLNPISCGSRKALASWGALTLPGAWVWRYTDVINRRWIRQYQT